MAGDDDLPRLLSGRYRLESILGQGGMGVVYGGVDLALKRPVAVKLIRGVDGEQLGDEVAGRFLREAKNTARLHHEHIIEVFDLGRTEEGSLYFVMELLVGESLSARLRREKRIAPASVVHIGVQICSALNVAHASGVIHRDLKPANIMLISRAGDREFVKVLDFGVAKSIMGSKETQLTHTGMLVGTIDYMAPEQIMGKPVDARTDIYSFGILLYRLLSGNPPFRDNGVPSLVNAHLNTMPPRLTSVVSGIPTSLDRVVFRCLAKAPKDRYATMEDLAEALAGSLGTADGILDDDDPYEREARTVFAPSKPPPAVTFDDATFDDARSGFDDTRSGFDETTIRIGAKPSSMPPPALPTSQRPSRLPPVQVPQRRSSRPPPREEFSIAETTVPIAHSGKCAMCQTLNPSHARVCGACGLSLASAEQEALRIRMQTGRAAGGAPAAPLPPTFPKTPPLPNEFVGAENEARVHRRPTSTDIETETARSLWQRLLAWTRGR